MDWSPKQDDGLRRGRRWVEAVGRGEEDSQVFEVLGFAGTGKSTLMEHIVGDMDGVVYCAPTGKAAMVMRSKGCPGAMTIHSALYAVKEKSTASLESLVTRRDRLLKENPDDPEIMIIKRKIEAEEKDLRKLSFSVNPDSPAHDARLLVIDEASMIDEQMGRDLIETGKPLLIMGDPGQLPPIRGPAFFMRRGDVFLDEIHRQARDSGILQLATDIRNGKGYRFGAYGNDCRVVRPGEDGNRELAISADQALCCRNITRRRLNQALRHDKGRHGILPVPGDKLVCLRNNNETGLVNGMQWTCDEPGVSAGKYLLGLGVQPLSSMDPFVSGTHVDTHVCIFNGDKVDPRDQRKAEHFDHAEAMTVHRGQGSQWDAVYGVDDWDLRDWSRGMYTLVTRAARRLTLVGK